MLTTEQCRELEDYDFKSSPDSGIDDSFMTDYFNNPSDEDFLQQLSSDLDIPLLLNAGDDHMGELNTFLDRTPEEILSEITSPVSGTKFEENGDEFMELQQLDLAQWGPEAYPNLKAEVKSEYNSDSPTPSQSSEASSSSIEIKHELPIETPPVSPNGNTNHFLNSFDHVENLLFTQPEPGQIIKLVPQNNIKLPSRQICIQPKTIPVAKNKKKVVVVPTSGEEFILNGSALIPASLNDSKVVITTINASPINCVSNITSCITVPSVPMLINEEVVPINSVNLRHPIDTRAFKRQQRMIKNRESACLSRKKKKDYLTSLEQKVQDLTLENDQLKAENKRLKHKLAAFADVMLKTSSTPLKMKKVALFIFIFLIGFNIDYIPNPFNSKSQFQHSESNKMTVISEHHGRSLLWTSNEEESKMANNTNNSQLPMCPMSVNQAESIRLALELERWIRKPLHNEKYHNSTKLATLKRKRKIIKNHSIDSPILSSVYRVGKRSRKLAHLASNELQIYSPIMEQVYSDFFEAIKRQDDTFYVVSFSADHLLLPALNHNKTRRPKMSLIMPSMVINGSSDSLVPLMQIDCEVLDTHLIHIKHGVIPQHLWTHGNTTQTQYENQVPPSNVSNSGDAGINNYTTPNYKPYFMRKSYQKLKNDIY